MKITQVTSAETARNLSDWYASLKLAISCALDDVTHATTQGEYSVIIKHSRRFIYGDVNMVMQDLVDRGFQCSVPEKQEEKWAQILVAW